MREIRLSGLAGGAAELNRPSLPRSGKVLSQDPFTGLQTCFTAAFRKIAGSAGSLLDLALRRSYKASILPPELRIS